MFKKINRLIYGDRSYYIAHVLIGIIIMVCIWLLLRFGFNQPTDITLKQYFPGSQKSADYPLIFFRRFIWLSRKAYAATTGTSQPSAFNFLRYALILRSLLN